MLNEVYVNNNNDNDDGRLDFSKYLAKSIKEVDQEALTSGQPVINSAAEASASDRPTATADDTAKEAAGEDLDDIDAADNLSAASAGLQQPGFGPGFAAGPAISPTYHTDGSSRRKLSRAALRGLFNRLDANRNGYVDVEAERVEIEAVVEEILAADLDSNGKISFLELSASLR